MLASQTLVRSLSVEGSVSETDDDDHDVLHHRDTGKKGRHLSCVL